MLVQDSYGLWKSWKVREIWHISCLESQEKSVFFLEKVRESHGLILYIFLPGKSSNKYFFTISSLIFFNSCGSQLPQQSQFIQKSRGKSWNYCDKRSREVKEYMWEKVWEPCNIWVSPIFKVKENVIVHDQINIRIIGISNIG